MKKRFKALSMIFIMTVVCAFAPFGASAQTDTARYSLPFDLNVASYLVVSLDTGEVIFEKDAHQQRTPASLTKMMTSYIALKYVDDLDGTTVTCSTRHTDELFGMNSSTADIRPGETVSMRNLIYAMMLPSGNEAANMVADSIGNGSKSNFYMIMNTEAKRLGCTDTNFSNPHGLFSDNHYTTAWDMYRIAKACYETPGFMEIATTGTYNMPPAAKHPNGYMIESTIYMQRKSFPTYYRSYVKGMKTGSLPEARHNFVSVCEKDGERYICVVMGAEYTDMNGEEIKLPAFVATAQIMDYFFEEYSLKPANNLEAPVTEVELKYVKDTDNLLLYPKSEVYSVLPNNVDESSFQKIFSLPESVSAPVAAGDVIGTVSYYIAGDLVGTTDLVCAESYERDFVIFLVEKITEALGSLYFRVVVVVTVLVFVSLAAYLNYARKKAEKMQKIHRRTKR
ncbi:MAG: D-alanyl-D-alanine carboxypeptidase [Oscillospiraceae bacterium]|nr:D-alanyl-D-alanine carboxypeptidase [Oscillospiraceae bacterium]